MGAGIGIIPLLTIVFVVLKLCSVIAWSWLWVFSPLWISAAITILVLLVMLFYYNAKKDDLEDW